MLKHVLLLIGLMFLVPISSGCDVEEGKPDAPEVTRPIQIDPDKETLDEPPPAPHNIDTATSPGQNVPTSRPATNPAPAVSP